MRGATLLSKHPVGPAPVDYDPAKIVYETIFDLPDTGLVGNNVVPMDDYQQDEDNPPPMEVDDILADKPRQYPTRSRRSVIGNQPYNRCSPRTTFLQLGEV